MAPPQHFYHDWEGEDWWPVDVNDGTEDQPIDVDFWTYCKDNQIAQDAVTQWPSAAVDFACKMCTDTLFKPVLTLCMHIFCYECLWRWLRRSHISCPTCDAGMAEPPIRDNGFEMMLAGAIQSGKVHKSATQPMRNVAGKDVEYDWSAFEFPTTA